MFGGETALRDLEKLFALVCELLPLAIHVSTVRQARLFRGTPFRSSPFGLLQRSSADVPRTAEPKWQRAGCGRRSESALGSSPLPSLPVSGPGHASLPLRPSSVTILAQGALTSNTARRRAPTGARRAGHRMQQSWRCDAGRKTILRFKLPLTRLRHGRG